MADGRLRKHFRGESAFPKIIKVRVYVIRAINIHCVGSRNSANPYLVFSIGKKRVSPALAEATKIMHEMTHTCHAMDVQPSVIFPPYQFHTHM